MVGSALPKLDLQLPQQGRESIAQMGSLSPLLHSREPFVWSDSGDPRVTKNNLHSGQTVSDCALTQVIVRVKTFSQSGIQLTTVYLQPSHFQQPSFAHT